MFCMHPSLHYKTTLHIDYTTQTVYKSMILQDGDGMLEVSRQTAVLGLDRPAVAQLLDLVVVLADHRLDGDGHAGHEAGAAALMAVVRHLGVLVQLPAGAVAHELADHGEACVLSVALDGIADVTDAVAGHGLFDALVQSSLGDVQQALGLEVDLGNLKRVRISFRISAAIFFCLSDRNWSTFISQSYSSLMSIFASSLMFLS